MSLRALTHVWEHSEAGGTDLLLLLAIADSYNDEEACCRASVAYLARKARIDRRSVQRHRGNLEALGELVVEERQRGNGSSTSSCYRLVGVGRQSAAPPGRQERRGGGGRGAAPGGGRGAAPGSQEDPKSDPRQSPPSAPTRAGNGKRPRDPLFDALACAGRAVDLEHLPASSARTIAVKLAELRRAQPDVTPAEISARAARYRREHPDWALTPAALVAHWAELAPAGTSAPRGPQCSRCAVRGPLQSCTLGDPACPGEAVVAGGVSG